MRALGHVIRPLGQVRPRLATPGIGGCRGASAAVGVVGRVCRDAVESEDAAGRGNDRAPRDWREPGRLDAARLVQLTVSLVAKIEAFARVPSTMGRRVGA